MKKNEEEPIVVVTEDTNSLPPSHRPQRTSQRTKKKGTTRTRCPSTVTTIKLPVSSSEDEKMPDKPYVSPRRIKDMPTSDSSSPGVSPKPSPRDSGISLSRSSSPLPSPTSSRSSFTSFASSSAPDLVTPSGGGESLARRLSVSLIYTPYEDGLINENKRPFDNVNFCFMCDKEFKDIKVSPRRKSVSNSNSSDITTASVSTTTTNTPTTKDNVHLKKSIEKTGMKTKQEGDTLCMIPVYRYIFLCQDCEIIVTNSKKESDYDKEKMGNVKITPRAMLYFK